MTSPQHHPQQFPPEQFPPQQQPAPSRGRGGPLALGVVIGAVVVALVGLVLSLTGVLRFGTAAAVGTDPVTMPDTLGDYRTTVAASQAKGASADQVASLQQRQDSTVRLTQQRYQQAFDGAATGVQLYSDADLQRTVTVIAVRSDSPGLFNGPVADPATLGLASSPSIPELVTVGDVECYRIATQTVKQGAQVADEDLSTTICHRSGDELSVWVHGTAFRGSAGTTVLAQLTDQAFAAVSGG